MLRKCDHGHDHKRVDKLSRTPRARSATAVGGSETSDKGDGGGEGGGDDDGGDDGGSDGGGDDDGGQERNKGISRLELKLRAGGRPIPPSGYETRQAEPRPRFHSLRLLL